MLNFNVLKILDRAEQESEYIHSLYNVQYSVSVIKSNKCNVGERRKPIATV